jgi:diguanylate cyclase (GGDEF)-like protein
VTGPQRILVVEDDPEIRYLLTTILVGEGREVLSAATGAEGRSRLEAGDVDLVVLDLILPDVDGRSLLSQMRDRAETAPVQVIVVTARGGPEARQDGYALGADAFVEKPFDPDELAADVTVRLGRALRAREAALTDPITGLANKAGLDTERSGFDGGYAIGLIEIDDFGARAERWGWDKAELVLAAIADGLRGAVGERAVLGRVGGGDFALLRAGADADALARIAEDALVAVKRVASTDVELAPGELTATIGVVVGERTTPMEEALDSARRRIFRSRESSGDQVVAEDREGAAPAGRILVAEDDAISASILVHKLTKEGLDVVRFDNGQEAYDAALAERPNLVILDVKMPGLDGFEVLDRLRKDTRFAAVPIVMLTSMGQEADVVRGFGLGADDYILKPFSPVELTARVRRLLKRGRSARAG